MKRNVRSGCFAVFYGFTLLAAGGQAWSAVIISYPTNISNAATTASLAPSIVAAGVVASNLEPTGLGAPLDFTGSFAFFGWEQGPVPEADPYIGFTLSTLLPVTYETLTYGLLSDANVPQ